MPPPPSTQRRCMHAHPCMPTPTPATLECCMYFFSYFSCLAVTPCATLSLNTTQRTHAHAYALSLPSNAVCLFFFMSDGDTRATSSLNTTQRMHAHTYARHPQMRYVCFFFLFFMSDGHPSLNTTTTHTRPSPRPLPSNANMHTPSQRSHACPCGPCPPSHARPLMPSHALARPHPRSLPSNAVCHRR